MSGGVPSQLHGKTEAIVIYNNLATIPRSTFQCPQSIEERAQLALDIDHSVRTKAPSAWKGDETREKQVLNELFPLLNRDREATIGLFQIIKRQSDY